MPLSLFGRGSSGPRHAPLAQSERAADHDELEAAFANEDDDDDDVQPSASAAAHDVHIDLNSLEEDVDDPLGRAAGPSSSPDSPSPQQGGYDFDSDPFSSRQSTSAPRPLSPLPSALPSSPPRTGLARFLPTRLGPFGYSSLPPRGASSTYGGGLGNDGVFANLNAKPERVRRQFADGTLEYVGGDDEGEGNKEAPPVRSPCFFALSGWVCDIRFRYNRATRRRQQMQRRLTGRQRSSRLLSDRTTCSSMVCP
jgi:hypothetical protein